MKKKTYSTINKHLSFLAGECPDRRAYTYIVDGELQEVHMTFGELDAQARAIAADLQKTGKKGDRVLLLYPPGLEFISAFFGCLYAGMIAVPASPPRVRKKSVNHSMHRIQAIALDARPSVVLTVSDYLDKVEGIIPELPELRDIRWTASDRIDVKLMDSWKQPRVQGDDLAFLQYTSGSTGTPKGVMVSHKNLLCNQRVIQKLGRVTENSIFAGWLPHYHDYALIGFMLHAVHLGIPYVFLSPGSFLQKPLRWLSAISRHRVTHSAAPNFAYELCAQKAEPEDVAKLDLSSWENAQNAAEPVQPETLKRFVDTFAPCGFTADALVPCYGLAEATLVVSGDYQGKPLIKNLKTSALLENRVEVAADTDDESESRPLAGCGFFLPEQKVVIADLETGAACAPDKIGEIWVKGDSVGRGYWEREEVSDDIFRAHLSDTGEGPFLRTGDLGFVMDNQVFLSGRSKDLIIIRGQNHYPQDIEWTVQASTPALKRDAGAAFSVDVDGESRLVIVQEIDRTQRDIDFNAVFTTTRRAVVEEHDLTLHAIILIQPVSIKRTTSGKIQRYASKQAFLEGELKILADSREMGLQKAKAPAAEESAGSGIVQIEDKLVELLAALLSVSPEQIDTNELFANYGLDSAAAVSISGELSALVGKKLPATLLYEYPSIQLLSNHLAETNALNLSSKSVKTYENEPIAVIGIGCRFPGGVDDPDSYWNLLRNGVDAISEIPGERWDVDAYYDPTLGASGKMNAKWGGFLDKVDEFEPQFFGISNREAKSMDPQQRLLLEVCWEALENAGINPEQLKGSSTGVFAGISHVDYEGLQSQNGIRADLNPYSLTGTAFSVAIGRLSYVLGLEGPALAVDTACSSSLVSVHLGCNSLRNGESNVVLAGGVNLILSPEIHVYFSQLKTQAPDGRVKAFDAGANGYSRGEGCGMVVLKRLSDAERDGDEIMAVIRGSAVNHDGRSNGLTAPSAKAQRDLIRKALKNADVKPADIGYVEAHGTGTPLGDPIEVNSLSATLGEGREQPLVIGSTKTNFGHLESAAGIAGFIKAVLALRNKEIPPTLHFKSFNPEINADVTALKVATEIMPWVKDKGGRLAGVSSFGFSGTNAHIILEESPAAVPAKAETMSRPLQLLALSAKTEESLTELCKEYAAHLAANPELRLEDVCFTANTGRTHFRNRLAVSAESIDDVRLRLAAFAQDGLTKGLIKPKGKLTPNNRPGVAFLFTGQGSQFAGMGRELYETQPVFRETINICNTLLSSRLEKSLLEILYPATEDESVINETVNTQAALFSIEYSLAKLWQSWGIQPRVVMGHSVGEYVAACLAGVFSLEDGLKLIAERGRLMQSLPPVGGMATVFTTQVKVSEIIAKYPDTVSLAAVNGPEHVVISGELDAVAKVMAELDAMGVETWKLNVSLASHSPLMDSILDEFERFARTITFNVPNINMISNVTGELIQEEIATAEYWRKHMRSPVLFAQGMATLYGIACDAYLEVGPKPVLLEMGQDCVAKDDKLWLPSLRASKSDWGQIQRTLGTLYVHGFSVDWDSFDRDYSRRKTNLPTYPFQRKRFWFNEGNNAMNEEISETKAVEPAPVAAPVVPAPAPVVVPVADSRDKVLWTLRVITGELLDMPPEEVDVHLPFLEMGADSIVLVGAIKKIQKIYQVKITIRQLFVDLTNVDQLVSFIVENAELAEAVEETPAAPVQEVQAPATSVSAETLAPAQQPAQGAVPATAMERVMAEQLQAMSQLMTQQLEILTENGSPAQEQLVSKPAPARPATVPQSKGNPGWTKKVESTKPASILPLWGVKEKQSNGLNPQQQEHLEALIKRYTARTQTSKATTTSYRPVLSDNRASAGFRFSTKEMLYPILGKSSRGSRFWDVDDNEYIDITMGFGVNLFGHHPDFVVKAVEEQLEAGIELGPQSSIAGEVAELITELTGMERVSFCNTGTEAVMTALRLVRSVTGRNKIAIFSGSYHGHFDGTLGESGDGEYAAPMAPGITESMISDVLVLDYDDPQSLEIIKAHAHELAGVLVEPVQSRKPGLQPKEFLQQLRRVTREENVPLIFDEMITGFRIHPGGAQAWFGVEADVATYGKIVGGGMPLGVVAGRASFMDGIDGGQWSYGDASFPQAETTFFAGTFCKHPLAMAAAKAILTRMKAEGPALQDRLNRRTEQLVSTINTYFDINEVPIRIEHFASLFRFSFKGNIDLLFYHLVEKGIYIWEGRNCFLSTDHTDEDLFEVINAVVESVEELRKGGFISGTSKQLAESDSFKKLDLFHVPGAPRKVLPSRAQKQLWVLAQIEQAGSIAYKVTTSLELTGSLDVGAMRKAVEQVVERHESLRTTFSNQGDFQIVMPNPIGELTEVDFSQLAEGEKAGALSEWREKEAQKLFDLARGPLFRAGLVKLEDQRHILVLSAHHIVIDGWSMGVVVNDLTELYSAACRGETSGLAAPVQFREHLELLDANEYSEEMAAHESYWLEKLSGTLPALNLPTDRPATPSKTYNGQRISQNIGKGLYAEIKRISKENGCTPFMVLLSVYMILMHRLTDSDDIIVGIPVAGRPQDESEQVVGYCTHILPIRSQLKAEDNFNSYLKTTRDLLLEAYEHEDYTFAKLLDQINAQRDAGSAPLVATTFNLDRPARLPDLHGLQAAALKEPISYTAFDLSLNVLDIDDALVMECDFNTDLFDATTAERLFGHYQTLLASIGGDSERNVSELPLLTDDQRHSILTDWNNTAADYPQDKTVINLFEEQVKRTPDAIAVAIGNETLTYKELNGKANQLAYHLMGQGVGAEGLVGIYVERSLEMVIGLLGILKAGGAYVPLDPDYPQERLQFMLEDSKVSALLSQNHLLEKLPVARDTDVKVFCLDSDWENITNLGAENPIAQSGPQHPAYVIYTSGSTGRPKGVVVEHGSLCSSTWARKAYYSSTELESFLLLSPVSFDSSVAGIFWSLTEGAKLVLPESQIDVDMFTKLVSRHNVTHLLCVPALYSEILSLADGLADSSLKAVIVAGESGSQKLLEQHHTELPDTALFNEYGPTEGTVWSTVHRFNVPDDNLACIGLPIANAQNYILDGHLQPMPIGVAGELHIGGAGLARGYLGRPELTEEKFISNPFSSDSDSRLYKTGDLARYLADGKIEFMGRIDHQVKVRGFRVELGEIETALGQHPAIAENAVIVHTLSETDKRLAAYLVPAEGNIDVAELRASLRDSLPDYMIPSYFVTLDALPLTPNGKLDRNALPKPEGASQSGVPQVMPQTEAEQLIAEIWKAVLKVETVGVHDNFFETGGNSLLAMQVQKKLSNAFDKAPAITDLFQYPTIETLAKHLTGNIQAIKLSDRSLPETNEFAIVGMSGRFPGAADVDTFWEKLRDGVESVKTFTDEELRSFGVEQSLLDDPRYVKKSAALEDIDKFDAAFFGYSPREAEILDPQQRLLLELAWEGLENAGYDVDRIDGKVGVYAGTGMNTYFLDNVYPNRELIDSAGIFQLVISNDKDHLTTRISYKLDLHGPSVNVQTACSTSLVAVHLAVRSLAAGECDMALAGGVSVRERIIDGYLHEDGNIRSPDGHCRAFDEKAAGFVEGNGAGMVVVKRLDKALADGDTIHAVIKGSAINNDGALKVGYTAPSIEAQAAVVAEAMRDIDAETIDYIEAHGTGTNLGDPVEVAALTKAFQVQTSKTNFCAIGSLKTNMGHLDSAAGIGGLIKTIQALKHRAIPPSLHFEKPNPKIDFANSPFFVNAELTEWKSEGKPRRAGVTSLGMGGTNAHVILEEAPAVPATDNQKAKREWQLLTLSARSTMALETATDNLARHFKKNSEQFVEQDLADAAYTLAVGRKVFDHRRVLVCRTTDGAVEALEAPTSGLAYTGDATRGTRSVAFMFSGQGTQYVNMALGLYEQEPLFRELVQECAETLKPHMNLLDILYPAAEKIDWAKEQLGRTEIAQPALFVVEYALARLWMSWGFQPAAMIGHSIGEYAAACLAGVFTLEDALGLVVVRGQLMQSMPAGAMLSVSLSEQDVTEYLNDELSLAAYNAPSMCVVSGAMEVIDALEKDLKGKKVDCVRLHTSHAFHSNMMEPILDSFKEQVQKVQLNAPQMPYMSNLSGTWITATEATSPDYWAAQLRGTVRFAEGLETLLSDSKHVLLEIGPGRALTTLAQENDENTTAFNSVRHPKDEQDDSAFLLSAFGKLWSTGVSIDWAAFYGEERRQRMPLPTYPFERKSYWLVPPEVDAVTATSSLRQKPDVADWFYVPSWKQSFLPKRKAKEEQSSWLVFEDECGLGRRVVEKLEQEGQNVIRVRVGSEFAKSSDTEFTLNPRNSEEYVTLLEELGKLNRIPQFIIHLWNVTPVESALLGEDSEADIESILKNADDIQYGGFYSLLFLAQALGKQSVSDDIRLAAVSNNMQAVLSGEEALCPEKATLLGPVGVIGHESPNIQCRSIDVSLRKNGIEKLVEPLLREMAANSPDQTVAYRGGLRWVKGFEPVQMEAQPEDTLSLRKEGVYLITGGLGGVGLTLAEELAKKAQARLVLVGRSEFPAEKEWDQWLSSHDESDEISGKIKKLLTLEAEGAEILTINADVAEPVEMQKAIETAEKRFGPLNGVIHAAGVSGGGMIQLKTPEMVESVMRPKLRGALVLDSILKNAENAENSENSENSENDSLDFFVMCSSLGSIVHAFGRVDYVGANAFLDSLAHTIAARGTNALTINWDTWQEVGMELDAEPQDWETEQLQGGMSSEDGLDAFYRAMAIGWPQVAVSTRDILSQIEYAKSHSMEETLEEPESGGVTHSRPKLSTEYVAPRNDMEQAIVDIWQKLIGIDQIGIHDNFFELGGHSLLATRVVSYIRDALGVEPPLAILFSSPTAAGLAAYVEKSGASAENSTELAAGGKIVEGEL